MKSKELLRRWQLPLSQRVGRSAEAVLVEGLVASDFPTSGVHIVFEDGSDGRVFVSVKQKSTPKVKDSHP